VTLSTWPEGDAKSTRLETSVPTAPTGAPESSFWAVSTGSGVVEHRGVVDGVTLMILVAVLLVPPLPSVRAKLTVLAKPRGVRDVQKVMLRTKASVAAAVALALSETPGA